VHVLPRPVSPTKAPHPFRRRNSALLTLAGVATTLPASAALVTRTLDTPLTIGGPETVEADGVTEAIIFNPKTGSIETLRSSGDLNITSGQVVLATETIATSDDKPILMVAGNNTLFLANADPSVPLTFVGYMADRLSEAGPIGPASNWGKFKPTTTEGVDQAIGFGVLKPDFPVWAEDTRGYLGFQMDALEPTGNQIYYQTNPGGWDDPAVPEYETNLDPEFIPSSAPLYGWAEIGYGADGYTLYRYAYDDSGAAISAVPEPSGSLALASLLGGSLLLRSRRKAQGSVAHV
jgi:hypothetical protein